MIKAALFDLDGVVFDTESQYSVFWGMIGKEYHPEIPDFAQIIKGQTLVQIYDKYFSDDKIFASKVDFCSVKDEQAKITARLDEFEQNMSYNYIAGFEDFVKDLRNNGIKCAVVDRVLTSEDFAKSKPDPDCYLKGAAYFGVKPEECVGLEDSFNGLKAVSASGAFTLGLATTNSADAIRPYSDEVISDYIGFTFADLVKIVSLSRK